MPSAAFRYILVLFKWYGCPKKCTQKSFVTLFPYIFHVKTNWWNRDYENFKIFLRDTNILPQMHWTLNICWPSGTTWGFEVSLNYPLLNFKKVESSKNIWIWHCCLKLYILRPNQHLLELSNNNSWIKCEICSKLTIELHLRWCIGLELNIVTWFQGFTQTHFATAVFLFFFYFKDWI